MKTTHTGAPLLASTLILWLIAAQSANAQILTTKHNFTGGVNSNPANAIHVKGGDNNDEICVYCHTPHASRLTSAPLWNKNLQGTLYTTYSSGTMQADTTSSELSTVSNNHVSLACLSCHDGVQAMDNMINAPSGAFNGNGGGIGGVTASVSGNWKFSSDWSSSSAFDSGGGGSVNALGQMQGNGSNGSAMGLNQSDNGGTVAMLSADLSNDHPIAMAYCGGSVVAGSGGSAACRDTYFNDASTTTDSSGQTMWYVPTTVSTVPLGASASSGLRLYGKMGNPSGNAPITNPTVECSSCHDPHSSNALFLRIPNSGSAVCLTCHSK